ncbi:tungstate ABC transporter substrate-binding protein WtpA [Candidatus Bathyarchaeota archaeon]|nr:tungstate ABC transporter substrate-binding protein WtpA [Candidatus Bathyarchaeota archaeon]
MHNDDQISGKTIIVIAALSIVVLGGLIYSYQAGYLFPDYLMVFHAGSLSIPLQRLGVEFSKVHPKVRVSFESSGSVDAVRKITDLGRSCDLLFVADWILIPKMMYDQHADWVLIFASNEMVIAYTDKSRYGDEINSMNWYKILSREDVALGRSDPNCDPCGYRALMVFQLASIYYGDPSINKTLSEHKRTVIRPKSVELLALLESGQIDYAFEYKSVAIQHNLKYVELPDEINLSNWMMRDYYGQAKVTIIRGDRRVLIVGAPILYGVTIPKNAENIDDAIVFIKFMLSEDGRRIIEECGQNAIYPAYTDDTSKIPPELRGYVQRLPG